MALRFSLFFCLLLTLSGCLYSLPEDEVSVNPITNSPEVVPNQSQQWMPGYSY